MRKFSIIAISLLVLAVAGFASCSGSDKTTNADSEHRFPDTLRVGTVYSPRSYFLYRGEEMGYDYDLVKRLAQDKNIVIDLKVAHNVNALVEMLDSGLIDLAAYEVPIIAQYRDRVLPAGSERITHQVLVQPKSSDSTFVSDVTELVGREVYVQKDTKYHRRLENLNDELGGGIIIHPVDRDTLIAEDMIDMVATGKIPLTIVDSDVADLNKTYYNSLDASLELSFPQRASWGVSPGREWLADSISAWMESSEPQGVQRDLMRRYFQLSKVNPLGTLDLSKGRISPYDELFKKYAKEIGWDWRLLAAQSFVESRFKPKAVSWAGARGIMQIMPRTARGYGLSMKNIFDPEQNIKTAVKLIGDLDKMLKSYVPDDEERKKFILAAYNGGIAHVYDAIALAKKYNKNPQVWADNVSDAVLMKSNPKYYNDPVVKYGYMRGKETSGYVVKIMDAYNQCVRQIPA